MMFEAFGFTQERTLHCRNLSQLPSVWTTLVVLIRTSDSQLFNCSTNSTNSSFHRARCWLSGSISWRNIDFLVRPTCCSSSVDSISSFVITLCRNIIRFPCISYGIDIEESNLKCSTKFDMDLLTNSYLLFLIKPQ